MTASDLTGFRGGTMGSSCRTGRAEAVSVPYGQPCHRPSLGPCSAPGSSFCYDRPEAGTSQPAGRSSAPSHVHGSSTRRSLPCFKCPSCAAGACQPQNQPEALLPCVRLRKKKAVLRKNDLPKRRYFHLGPALVNPELCRRAAMLRHGWGRASAASQDWCWELCFGELRLVEVPPPHFLVRGVQGPVRVV